MAAHLIRDAKLRLLCMQVVDELQRSGGGDGSEGTLELEQISRRQLEHRPAAKGGKPRDCAQSDCDWHLETHSTQSLVVLGREASETRGSGDGRGVAVVMIKQESERASQSGPHIDNLDHAVVQWDELVDGIRHDLELSRFCERGGVIVDS